MSTFVTAMPNDKSTRGRRPSLISDDPAAIQAFAERWDRPGWAVYYCVNPLRPGAASRCRDTISGFVRLHVDLDFKDIKETPAEADLKLVQLPLEPTEVRDSGGGRHLIFELKEEVEADAEEFEQACMLLKRLTVALCGDPAPAHPAALLRMLGTHNSKRGEPVLVKALWGSGKPVDISDIEALVDMLPEAGIFARKEVAYVGNGHAAHSFSSTYSGKLPVDIDERFARMRLHGPGDSSINITQRDVMAALLGQGISLTEATETVLTATQACVAGTPEAANWDWHEEELEIGFERRPTR